MNISRIASILCGIFLMTALSACSNCADIRAQLDAQIPVCPPVGESVNIASCGCDECAQEYITVHLHGLGCGAWYTSVTGCTWTVTMGSAE